MQEAEVFLGQCLISLEQPHSACGRGVRVGGCWTEKEIQSWKFGRAGEGEQGRTDLNVWRWNLGARNLVIGSLMYEQAVEGELGRTGREAWSKWGWFDNHR